MLSKPKNKQVTAEFDSCHDFTQAIVNIEWDGMTGLAYVVVNDKRCPNCAGVICKMLLRDESGAHCVGLLAS